MCGKICLQMDMLTSATDEGKEEFDFNVQNVVAAQLKPADNYKPLVSSSLTDEI